MVTYQRYLGFHICFYTYLYNSGLMNYVELWFLYDAQITVLNILLLPNNISTSLFTSHRGQRFGAFFYQELWFY